MDSQTDEILARLERLAKNLDVQQYPGEAWPTTAQPATRRRSWKVAALVAAVAASVAMIIHFLGGPPQQEGSTPGAKDLLVAREPIDSVETTPEDIPFPTILVVEDHDSYSFIDMTTDVPLVSFTKRDTFTPGYVVPLMPITTSPLHLDNEM
mgnify:CR=1 FL=1